MNPPTRALAAALALLCGLQGAALVRAADEPLAAYVAMGSAFADGPGLTTYAADAPACCARSVSQTVTT
jgi:hypothetical protein